MEFAGLEAGVLDELVEAGDGFGAVGHQSHRLAPVTCLLPGGENVGVHVAEGAAVKAAPPFIFGEHNRVAGSEAEAGLAFPLVAEPVDLVEFDCCVGR